MWAMLGAIPFEVVGSPEGYDSTGAYNYAEQKVIEAKPPIQWTGDDLQRINFEIVWNVSFTNPALQLAALRAAAAAHVALPLIFGVGTYVGLFVIESIKLKALQTSDLGGLVSIRVALALKEYAASATRLAAAVSTIFGNVAATPAPASGALGIAPAATVPAGVNSSSATAGASPLLSNANAIVPAPNPDPLEAFGLDPDDVPLAAIVRAPAAFASTNAAAFVSPEAPPLGALAQVAAGASVGAP